MALIVEFAIPAAKFALSETLSAVHDTTLEIGRVTVESPGSIAASVWAYTADFDALEAALEDDPTVASFAITSETDGERSYRMSWNEPIELLVHILTKQEGTIIHAVNAADIWVLSVSFPERGALIQIQELQDLAQQNGFSLDVQRIYQTDRNQASTLGLTDHQQDVLMAAFESGYFKVPKEVTLKELAEQQGVSHQAVSEQLRRGLHQLLEQTLITATRNGEQDE